MYTTYGRYILRIKLCRIYNLSQIELKNQHKIYSVSNFYLSRQITMSSVLWKTVFIALNLKKKYYNLRDCIFEKL